MRMKATMRQTGVWPTFGVVFCALLFFLATMAGASQPEQQTVPASSESVRASFDNALESVQSDLAGLEQGVERWDFLKTNTLQEVEAFRVQNAVHENLLLSLQTRIETLQSALNANRIAMNRLAERVIEFEKIGSLAPGWLADLSDRIAIAEKRLAELKQDGLSESQNREMHGKLKSLLDILYAKKKQGEAFLKEQVEILGTLKQTSSDLTQTREQLEIRLQSQKKEKLFERHPVRFGAVNVKSIATEINAAVQRTAGIGKAKFWEEQWVKVQYIGGTAQAIFLFVFFMVVLFRKKIWRLFQLVEGRLDGPDGSARRLALMLFRRSFFLIGAAIFLWLYDFLKLPYVNYHAVRFLNDTVFTLLLSRWGIDYFQNRLRVYNSDLNLLVQKRLINLIRMLRLLIVVYLASVAIFGPESVTVWLFGLAIEAFLFIWTIRFWRSVDDKVIELARKGEGVPPQVVLHTARGWGQLVIGLAILMELIGYHALAGHWLVSWAETLALALWACIGWLSIQEWQRSQKGATGTQATGEKPKLAAPVSWFVVQMARLLWFTTALSGVLTCWAGSDVMLEALGKFFQLDFSVGSLTVSIKGILLALILIFATHVATRVGTRLLSEKVLDSRNFERGLKDSIITVTNYAVWGLGILLALGLLGVNTTSLAVVFGALSIGIGFGLQNIFNNFISGLILLFERPIQVGDYIEIGGLWAEVKKIQVRATIVQTFDNATVIIPNSDLISQQVTNWSFKDPRMRRHVDVGVAYGSDIELVRKALLEIPDGITDILKYPRPDVLFMDHGDSALIFRLRYWTNVDNYYSTSTAVRFALDHKFRELGIEIAFPQMDLHLRSDDTKGQEKKADLKDAEPLPQGS